MNEHLYDASTTPLKIQSVPVNNHMSFKFSDLRSGRPPHLDKMPPEEREDIEKELELEEKDKKREKFTGHNWLFHSWVSSDDAKKLH
jgi:hypothetical protein